MVGKTSRLQIIPQQSTQNTANFPLQTYEKTSELFNMGDNFSLRNNFDNSGSFAKVSIPVHIYNSLEKSNSNSELSPLYTCKISRLGNYQNLSYKQFLKANQNGNLHLWGLAVCDVGVRLRLFVKLFPMLITPRYKTMCLRRTCSLFLIELTFGKVAGKIMLILIKIVER